MAKISGLFLSVLDIHGSRCACPSRSPGHATPAMRPAANMRCSAEMAILQCPVTPAIAERHVPGRVPAQRSSVTAEFRGTIARIRCISLLCIHFQTSLESILGRHLPTFPQCGEGSTHGPKEDKVHSRAGCSSDRDSRSAATATIPLWLLLSVT